MNLPHVILASKSPRRRQLLEWASVPYEVLELDVDESFDPDIPPEQVAELLAVRKARAAEGIRPGELVLAADSVVIKDSVIYEKPIDRADAIRIIQSISGGSHIVTTGVCLIEGNRELSFTDISKVDMAEMTLEEIEWYIDEWQPYDKAGAYGIQDWIGHCKVTAIEGSYDTIMGLPTHRVYQALRNWDD